MMAILTLIIGLITKKRRSNKMTYIVKVNVSNNWFIRCSTKDLKLANQQADKMREQGFEVRLEEQQ